MGRAVLKCRVFLESIENFQMKARRQKKSQPKKVCLALEQVPTAPSSFFLSKAPSTHTKAVTATSIHQTCKGNGSLSTGKRGKKSANPTGREGEGRGLPTSKSSKKVRIPAITLHKSSKQNGGQFGQLESYREYCLVDSNFFGLSQESEQALSTHFLAKATASTCDFSSFKPSQPAGPSWLRRKSISQRSLRANSFQEQVEKIDQAISGRPWPQSDEKEVEVAPEMTEIGMQYSERKELDELRKEQVTESLIKQLGRDDGTQNTPVKQDSSQSLSDLFLKLEFSHLGDDSSFKSLTSNQKEHFSQVLQTVMTKLKPTKKKPSPATLKPIILDPISQLGESSLTSHDETYSKPVIESRQGSDGFMGDLPSYQPLQALIFTRQCRQMNWIEQLPCSDKGQTISTSLFSVVNFLCHLFCYIEVEYCEQFLYMIRKMHGLTYREKYKRISKGQPYQPPRNPPVISESVFLDFINENNSGVYGQCEAIHLRAVFEAFNQHLQEYRPFYQGNGEQFPWSLKIFVTMSEYSIDQDSLQIIFRQSREKLVEWAGLLCGLILPQQDFPLLPGNPLELRNTQREDRMMEEWLTKEPFEKDAVEVQSTLVMHQLSQQIWGELVGEAVGELSLLL